MPAPLTIPLKYRPNWAWLWLSYTGFLFLDPILEPGRHLWLATFAVFIAFLAIFFRYVRCVSDGEPTRLWMIAATFLLGLVAFPWNQGASCLMVYAFCFVPFAFESVRRVFALYALGSLIIFAEGYYFTVHVPHGLFHVGWVNTFIAIFLVLIIGGGNIFFAEQRRFHIAQAAAQRALQGALEENLALAAVAERERIARDLHDVLGHTLSVIVLKAELASRLLTSTLPAPEPRRAAAEIADVERIARTALGEVREAIGGYRARGLASEIEAARLILDAAGVSLILDSASSDPLISTDSPAAPSPPALSVQEETALALALREAVTNIVRHARATTCRLRFLTEDNHRRLLIEDNGAAPGGPNLLREGSGLRGMRQRIESIGGSLSLDCGIAGAPGNPHGTRLLIELPLREHTAP